MTIVHSHGGGTQSAAVTVMYLTGELPRPDMVVFADTSREMSTTWDYLNTYVRPALEAAHIPFYIAPHGLATVDLYAGNGDLLIPAITRQSGYLGQMSTFCSNEWKQRVVQRFLRSVGVDDCDVWIGMSTDEMERMKASGLNWYRNAYPLVEIVPTSRHQCVSKATAYGWPMPPKSRCWMCPMQSPYEWSKMRKESPADFARAVELDNAIREKDSDVYLHRFGVPLEQAIDVTDQQPDMFDGCDSGYCWT